MNIATAAATPHQPRNWLKLVGKIGFWFFFLNGLLWMAAPLVFYYLM